MTSVSTPASSASAPTARPTSASFARAELSPKLLLFALVTIVAQTLTAQEDGAFQKLPDGVEESAYAPIAPGEGAFQEARVMPPSWFVNLPERRVDVLIYDEGVGGSSFSVSGKGARLLDTETFPNDNYVKLTLLVDADAEPTTLQLRGTGGKSYAFPLEEAKQPSPMSPADMVYLVMPDRFANGATGDDDLAGMAQRGTARDKVFFRHGGDLTGVRERLDYIHGLGATTLWLNPVLENDQPYESYHGYAVTDHYRVDDRFGGNLAYRRLVDDAHDKGMKVLMDMVPNHAGDEHFLYADMPSRDWWHLPDSFVRSNFRIPAVLDPHAAEVDRERMLNGWFDRHMPDFDQDNPDVRTYFTQLALWWIGHSGHDGYRVDTYPYSDPAFMAEWSRAVHDNFPTVSFFGEVWVDGLPNQAAFVPGFESRVDPGANPSVTDFQLKDAIMEAIHQEQGWVSGVGKLYLTLTQDYLYEDPNALITFLDNHDLSRLASNVGGDVQKIKSALTLLLTLRGTPMMYYGTEIAMGGSGGAFGEGGRKDMPGGWEGDAVNAFTEVGLSPKQTEVLSFVRELGQFRRANPDFFEGAMTQFVPENGVYMYVREGEAGRKLAVVYNSNEEAADADLTRLRAHLGEGTRWTDYRGGSGASAVPVTVDLTAKETGVWVVE